MSIHELMPDRLLDALTAAVQQVEKDLECRLEASVDEGGQFIVWISEAQLAQLNRPGNQ